MKLNKKKWFLKNIIEFDSYYQEGAAISRILRYERWGQIGGRWDYNCACALPAVRATIRVLYNLEKPWKQYFYLRRAKLRNIGKVKLVDIRFRDAL